MCRCSPVLPAVLTTTSEPTETVAKDATAPPTNGKKPSEYISEIALFTIAVLRLVLSLLCSWKLIFHRTV